MHACTTPVTLSDMLFGCRMNDSNLVISRRLSEWRPMRTRHGCSRQLGRRQWRRRPTCLCQRSLRLLEGLSPILQRPSHALELQVAIRNHACERRIDSTDILAISIASLDPAWSPVMLCIQPILTLIALRDGGDAAAEEGPQLRHELRGGHGVDAGGASSGLRAVRRCVAPASSQWHLDHRTMHHKWKTNSRQDIVLPSIGESEHLRWGGVPRSCAVHCLTMRAIARAVSTGLACPSALLPAAGAVVMCRSSFAAAGSGVCNSEGDANAACSCPMAASCAVGAAAGVAGSIAAVPEAACAPAKSLACVRSCNASVLSAKLLLLLLLLIWWELRGGVAAVPAGCSDAAAASGKFASTGKPSMGMWARLRACQQRNELSTAIQPDCKPAAWRFWECGQHTSSEPLRNKRQSTTAGSMSGLSPCSCCRDGTTSAGTCESEMSRLVTQPAACLHAQIRHIMDTLSVLTYLQGVHCGDEGASTLHIRLGSERLPPHIRDPCQHNLHEDRCALQWLCSTLQELRSVACVTSYWVHTCGIIPGLRWCRIRHSSVPSRSAARSSASGACATAQPVSCCTQAAASFLRLADLPMDHAQWWGPIIWCSTSFAPLTALLQ